MDPLTHSPTDANTRAVYQRENTMVENLSIYTDASGTDGEIGVAAAYPFPQRPWSIYIEPGIVSNKYIAKLQGISLALQIV